VTHQRISAFHGKIQKPGLLPLSASLVILRLAKKFLILILILIQADAIPSSSSN
jgi:hypothetical protein